MTQRLNQERERLEDFSIGDRVFHRGLKTSGTVTAAGKSIEVTYDQICNNGRNLQGKYSASWFRLIGLLEKLER